MPTNDVQEQTSLSQMNAETLIRATTLLFGEHESCTFQHPQYMHQCNYLPP